MIDGKLFRRSVDAGAWKRVRLKIRGENNGKKFYGRSCIFLFPDASKVYGYAMEGLD
jgi:hypothetical protein